MTEYGLKLEEDLKVFKGTKLSWVNKWLAACERLMPNHYDIQVRPKDSSFQDILPRGDWTRGDIPFVVLHFENLTITNDVLTQPILDMYVYILFDNSNLYGTRTTYTAEQFQSGYAHSHISENGNIVTQGSIGSFCIGTGPIRATLLKQCENEDEFDVETAMLLIKELEVYLCWESEEGGPFYYMKNIYKEIQPSSRGTNYVGKSLSTYIKLEDLDFSNPMDIRLRDDFLVKDSSAIYDIEHKVAQAEYRYLKYVFRDRVTELKVIFPSDWEEIQKKAQGYRKLNNAELDHVRTKISGCFKEAVLNDHIESSISIDFITQS